MASDLSYSEIIIIGSGIELLWTALICAQRKPKGTSISLYEISNGDVPVFCAGPWLDELHELMGVSHDQFLKLVKPRLCLGLDIHTRNNHYFLPSAPTGMPFKGIPFVRLYSALFNQQTCAYTDYNFARQLRRSNCSQPPRNLASVMCDGLQMEYSMREDRYRLFLSEQLREATADIAMFQLDVTGGESQKAESLIAKSQNTLVLDLTCELQQGSFESTARPIGKASFFAVQQLVNNGNQWLYSISCDNERQLDINYLWGRLPVDVPCRLTGNGSHHIKLGSGRNLCVGNLPRRVLFCQLRDLYTFWPEPATFLYLIKRFNRSWQGWLEDANEFYDLLQAVACESPSISAINRARIELFEETGGFAQRDRALVQSWEWENLITGCLGVAPKNRGLPRGLDFTVVAAHMQQIRQSFAIC